MTSFSDLTAEQRLAASAKSAQIRGARARVKREIRGGQITTVAVLADPPAELLGMKVIVLLTARKWFGPNKAQALMNRLRIAQGRTIGGLSERQREALIDALA